MTVTRLPKKTPCFRWENQIYPEIMRVRQQELKFKSHGGRREGAGRPKGHRVSHAARARFEQPAALHITLRVAAHVWNLRSSRSWRVLRRCFGASRGRFGVRLIHFAVLGNHLHLIVEAEDSGALSRAMQGLLIRIARALNRMMRRDGTVFADHYHSRLLRTPSELVNAIAYVLGNHEHHYDEGGENRFSSLAPAARPLLCAPRTWLLRSGWRRARHIPHWFRPPIAAS
jgi:REP element-mobilizing transposase RayT